MKRCFFTLLLLFAVVQPATVRAGKVDLITFPGRDFPLRAAMFVPGTPGQHPAVIALHGCAGLYSSEGVLNPRHQDWGDRLAAAGFIVLMPDSYGSGGLGRQCKVRDRM